MCLPVRTVVAVRPVLQRISVAHDVPEGHFYVVNRVPINRSSYLVVCAGLAARNTGQKYENGGGLVLIFCEKMVSEWSST